MDNNNLHYYALKEQLEQIGFSVQFILEPKMTASELKSFLLPCVVLSPTDSSNEEVFRVESHLSIEDAFRIFKSRLFSEEFEFLGFMINFEIDPETQRIKTNNCKPAYH